MEDSRHIENLIYSYAERIDNGDLDGVAHLFRDGEIFSATHDVRRTGFDEVLEMYQTSTRLYESTNTPQRNLASLHYTTQRTHARLFLERGAAFLPSFPQPSGEY